MLNQTLRTTRDVLAEVAIISVALFFPLVVVLAIAGG
jgi:hypothetical protein